MIDHKKFTEYIRYVADAHQEKVLPTAKAFRYFPSGERNPYFTHPLWCAEMMLLETALPEQLREDGAVALLFHDVLEDTSAPLPDGLSAETVRLIQDMTYANFAEEVAGVLAKDKVVHLVKLYDKVAALYDACLRSFRYPEWLDFTEKLLASVEQNYGELHIVILGRELCKKYRAMVAAGTIPQLPSELAPKV